MHELPQLQQQPSGSLNVRIESASYVAIEFCTLVFQMLVSASAALQSIGMKVSAGLYEPAVHVPGKYGSEAQLYAHEIFDPCPESENGLVKAGLLKPSPRLPALLVGFGLAHDEGFAEVLEDTTELVVDRLKVEIEVEGV